MAAWKGSFGGKGGGAFERGSYVCMYVCMYGDGGDFTWCVYYIISISVSIAVIANVLSARIPTFNHSE